MTAPLRKMSDAAVTTAPVRRLAMGAALFRDGIVAADALVNVLSHQGREAGHLPDMLRARGLVGERDILQTEARNWGCLLYTSPSPRD